MATRGLRLALWQHRRHLRRRAAARERAARHLIDMADILTTVGRAEPARCLLRTALRFRVKAICLTARAETLNWRSGGAVHPGFPH